MNGAYDDLLCFEKAEMPDLNKSLDNMEENELLFGETGPDLNVSISSSDERPSNHEDDLMGGVEEGFEAELRKKIATTQAHQQQRLFDIIKRQKLN